jgi:hypothetical protein
VRRAHLSVERFHMLRSAPFAARAHRSFPYTCCHIRTNTRMRRIMLKCLFEPAVAAHRQHRPISLDTATLAYEKEFKTGGLCGHRCGHLCDSASSIYQTPHANRRFGSTTLKVGDLSHELSHLRSNGVLGEDHTRLPCCRFAGV